MVPAERSAETPSNWINWRPATVSPAREYGEVLGFLAVLTLVSWFLSPHTGYLTVGLLFLLAVIVLSLRVGPGPVFVAGVVSALTWDFLFIPPLFTFEIDRFGTA